MNFLKGWYNVRNVWVGKKENLFLLKMDMTFSGNIHVPENVLALPMQYKKMCAYFKQVCIAIKKCTMCIWKMLSFIWKCVPVEKRKLREKMEIKKN